jgi:hypothetical protein
MVLMKRLLVGCGLVMAIGLVGVIVTTVVMYSWWKQNAPDTTSYEAVVDGLRESFGEPADYQPPLDGSLDPARVATYVGVREAVVAARDTIAENAALFLAEVSAHESEGESLVEGLGRGLSFAKKGIRVFRDGVTFLTIRAEAMRDAGIGEGEYAYLDALATHAWLGWDAIAVAESDPLSEADRDVMEGVEEYVDRQRDLVLGQLRGARRSLEALDAPSAEESAFLETITGALDDANANRGEFPFARRMPDAWAAVLEPFRGRIQATLPKTMGEVLIEGADQLLDSESGFSFDVQSGH